MNNFQIAVLSFFVVAAVLAVAIFALSGSFGGGEKVEVLLWGAFPRLDIEEALSSAGLAGGTGSALSVRYEEKRPDNFDAELAEALAEGKGPDMVLIPQEGILRHKGKILPVPYDSYSARRFRDAFAEEGELFLGQNGVLGFPLLIDPLLMYWNRSLFSSAGLSQPPRFWDEFFTMAPKLTERDEAGNIGKSAAALGGYSNVSNAKEIISALVLQAGNPIASFDANGNLLSVFGDRFNAVLPPAEAAVRFYTEFSDPAKPVYSWNRSLPLSENAFAAGDLAVYFGFGGEVPAVRGRNPNLNFDIASLPQARDGAEESTFGRIYALSILSASRNANGAFQAVVILSEGEAAKTLSDVTGLPPARRGLLSQKPNDVYGEVLYNGAITAKGWLDPNGAETNRIFREMTEDITSGRARISEAVGRADREIDNLLK